MNFLKSVKDRFHLAEEWGLLYKLFQLINFKQSVFHYNCITLAHWCDGTLNSWFFGSEMMVDRRYQTDVAIVLFHYKFTINSVKQCYHFPTNFISAGNNQIIVLSSVSFQILTLANSTQFDKIWGVLAPKS